MTIREFLNRKVEVMNTMTERQRLIVGGYLSSEAYDKAIELMHADEREMQVLGWTILNEALLEEYKDSVREYYDKFASEMEVINYDGL